MRAEPMKFLGLNVAIPFAVPIRLRCYGFRSSPALRRRPLKRGASGLQGGAASSRADSVSAS
jgi:hypothetical protein